MRPSSMWRGWLRAIGQIEAAPPMRDWSPCHVHSVRMLPGCAIDHDESRGGAAGHVAVGRNSGSITRPTHRDTPFADRALDPTRNTAAENSYRWKRHTNRPVGRHGSGRCRVDCELLLNSVIR